MVSEKFQFQVTMSGSRRVKGLGVDYTPRVLFTTYLLSAKSSVLLSFLNLFLELKFFPMPNHQK